ncbi:hypothetical protein Bbelb_120170 [Branchiostoma belcheri]|nr:hypothetical protein Bbelb_120170 [Branchiostoma belcheri]
MALQNCRVPQTVRALAISLRTTKTALRLEHHVESSEVTHYAALSAAGIAAVMADTHLGSFPPCTTSLTSDLRVTGFYDTVVCCIRYSLLKYSLLQAFLRAYGAKLSLAPLTVLSAAFATVCKILASTRLSYGGTDTSLHQAFLRGYGAKLSLAPLTVLCAAFATVCETIASIRPSYGGTDCSLHQAFVWEYGDKLSLAPLTVLSAAFATADPPYWGTNLSVIVVNFCARGADMPEPCGADDPRCLVEANANAWREPAELTLMPGASRFDGWAGGWRGISAGGASISLGSGRMGGPPEGRPREREVCSPAGGTASRRSGHGQALTRIDRRPAGLLEDREGPVQARLSATGRLQIGPPVTGGLAGNSPRSTAGLRGYWAGPSSEMARVALAKKSGCSQGALPLLGYRSDRRIEKAKTSVSLEIRVSTRADRWSEIRHVLASAWKPGCIQDQS